MTHALVHPGGCSQIAISFLCHFIADLEIYVQSCPHFLSSSLFVSVKFPTTCKSGKTSIMSPHVPETWFQESSSHDQLCFMCPMLSLSPWGASFRCLIISASIFHHVGLKDQDCFGDFCLFLAAPHSLGILVSQLRTEPGPLQWKLGVLNTGPPGYLVAQLCLTFCNPMDCSLPVSSVHGDSPGKNTGVGCYVLLQGIFPTQGLNPSLLHCRWILYHLSHQGSPRTTREFPVNFFFLQTTVNIIAVPSPSLKSVS